MKSGALRARQSDTQRKEWTQPAVAGSFYAPASFVARRNFFPHCGQEKCLMCNAGPRPSFGCISHSFAGPATSPPHFRHLTKRSSPRWGRQSVSGHGRAWDGEATWFGWGCGHCRCVHFACPTLLTAMRRQYTFDGILMFHLWYINISGSE